jgi:hypothetical protein
MHVLQRPAGDQMFDTRAWRGLAVVGGDGIELPTSTELAEHSPKPLKTPGFGAFRTWRDVRSSVAIGGIADMVRAARFGSF